MKPVYFLIALFLFGCSSSDEEDPEIIEEKPKVEISISPKSLTLNYKEEGQISISGADISKCELKTKDKFIADVSGSGKVTANHVGTVKIYASFESSKDSCTATVSPISDDVAYPVRQWGISLSDLKSKEVNTLYHEDSGRVIYRRVKDYAYIYYIFKDEKLLYAYTDIGNTSLSILSVTGALRERYDYLTYTSSAHWFSSPGQVAAAKEKGGNPGCVVYFAATADIITSKI